MNTNLSEVPLGKRNNYFSGKLLNAEDFNDEQTYQRNKMRLHNRLLRECGCISGLKVSTARNKKGSVIVHAGVAIDPQGNEIVVASDTEFPVPEDGKTAYLVAYWAEQETDFVTVPGGNDDRQMLPSKIEEYAIFRYEPAADRIGENGVVLARLEKVRGKWTIDKKYRVRRGRPKHE